MSNAMTHAITHAMTHTMTHTMTQAITHAMIHAMTHAMTHAPVSQFSPVKRAGQSHTDWLLAMNVQFASLRQGGMGPRHGSNTASKDHACGVKHGK